MTEYSTYTSALTSRYASTEMLTLFSQEFKHSTWRKLWTELAKAEKELGIDITDSQIHSLESHQHTINFEQVKAFEKIYRHDVMAHIHAYGEDCKEAKGIIHLGATSCYVTDNTDLIQMKEGLKLLRSKILFTMSNLATFAASYAHLATLSFTHFQPAQPTTVGKRACLWLQDLLFDFEDLSRTLEDLPFFGVKGATGTQASFLTLFQGDEKKVRELEKKITKSMGFKTCLPISSQTYSRKIDMRIFSVLSGLAATASKIGTDLRLLAHLKEMEESFAAEQVGSSAMPHKRNPMRSERICGLARFLLSLQENPAYTAATQWLERSLDDSANRRLAIPEGFLAADALINLLQDVTKSLVINTNQIEKNLKEELPFLALENILICAVKKGKDRQIVHEQLRKLSIQTKQTCKQDHLLDAIARDSIIGLTKEELEKLLNIQQFIGRAPAQVFEFLENIIHPLLKEYKSFLNIPLPNIEV